MTISVQSTPNNLFNDPLSGCKNRRFSGDLATLIISALIVCRCAPHRLYSPVIDSALPAPTQNRSCYDTRSLKTGGKSAACTWDVKLTVRPSRTESQIPEKSGIGASADRAQQTTPPLGTIDPRASTNFVSRKVARCL